jgi:hypothetical protein
VPPTAGVGLRPVHHAFVLEQRPPLPWFEAHAENFMSGGLLAEDLDEIAKTYPLSLHAVGLSLASADGLDAEHVKRFRALIERHRPSLVSDHLSWSGIGALHVPDLLPLPYTKESLALVADNVARAQDTIGRRLLLENPSVYLAFAGSTMAESAFLGALADRTGCGVLLDINNIYVSAHNLGEDVDAALDGYLRHIDHRAIGEIHLAGHERRAAASGASLLVDTHGGVVCTDVWSLYEKAIAALGPRPTLIEWDTALPGFEVLAREAAHAAALIAVTQEHGGAHALA